MMKTEDFRFKEAYHYAFEEVFPAIFWPIERLLENASSETTPKHRSALLASSCVMILMGIKTMTKFYSFGADARDDLERFVQHYFPSSYRWQFKKLYRAYEQGLLYYLGYQQAGAPPVVFTAAAGEPAFSYTADSVFEVNVGAFFEDFTNAVERFKSNLRENSTADERNSLYYCCEKIRSTCLKEW